MFKKAGIVLAVIAVVGDVLAIPSSALAITSDSQYRNIPACFTYQGQLICPHAYAGPYTGDLSNTTAMWAWVRYNCQVISGPTDVANGQYNPAGDEECHRIMLLAISIDTGIPELANDS